jgi:hypothetical protein
MNLLLFADEIKAPPAGPIPKLYIFIIVEKL